MTIRRILPTVLGIAQRDRLIDLAFRSVGASPVGVIAPRITHREWQSIIADRFPKFNAVMLTPFQADKVDLNRWTVAMILVDEFGPPGLRGLRLFRKLHACQHQVDVRLMDGYLGLVLLNITNITRLSAI